MLTIDVITIFPGMFRGPFDESMIKRAQDNNKLVIRLHNLRDYTTDKHRQVDDRPFGGGSGMLLKPEPIFAAVKSLLPKAKNKRKKCRVILTGPRGQTFTQKAARRLAHYNQIILISGHYEGVDQRVRDYLADEEISIGDYVLTGGELAAMVIVDSVARLLPGVLGDKNSLNFESFEDNLLEYPQYSRPADFQGMKVPPVLLNGNHKQIESWRRRQAIETTKRLRPDLATGGFNKNKENKQCKELKPWKMRSKKQISPISRSAIPSRYW